MVNIGTTALSVGAVLKEKNQTVAVAESSSGGLISAALLAVPGASSYFKGGGVVYTSQSKTILVDVSEEEMQANRAATAAHARGGPTRHSRSDVPSEGSAERNGWRTRRAF